MRGLFCEKLKKGGSWSKISNLQQVRDFSFFVYKFALTRCNFEKKIRLSNHNVLSGSSANSSVEARSAELWWDGQDGRTDGRTGRTGQDLHIFIFMGERFRGQLNPLWVSQFGMYSSHWIESRTRYAYKKYTCDLFDLGDENYIIFCSLEELGWEFCFEGQ